MNVYANTDFTGHYPIGTAAIVVADSPEEACELLNARLKVYGLKGDAEAKKMLQISLNHKLAIILRDGNY